MYRILYERHISSMSVIFSSPPKLSYPLNTHYVPEELVQLPISEEKQNQKKKYIEERKL